MGPEVRAMALQMTFLGMNVEESVEKRKQREKNADVCAANKEPGKLKLMKVTSLLLKVAVMKVVVILALILMEVGVILRAEFQGFVALEVLGVNDAVTRTQTTMIGKERMSGFLKETLWGA
jgi:hypothetical protein